MVNFASILRTLSLISFSAAIPLSTESQNSPHQYQEKVVSRAPQYQFQGYWSATVPNTNIYLLTTSIHSGIRQATYLDKSLNDYAKKKNIQFVVHDAKGKAKGISRLKFSSFQDVALPGSHFHTVWFTSHAPRETVKKFIKNWITKDQSSLDRGDALQMDPMITFWLLGGYSQNSNPEEEFEHASDESNEDGYDTSGAGGSSATEEDTIQQSATGRPWPKLYEDLDVPKTASSAEIKKKYRLMVLACHPDKNGGDDTKFKIIQHAWEILGDTKYKEFYDKNKVEPKIE